MLHLPWLCTQPGVLCQHRAAHHQVHPAQSSSSAPESCPSLPASPCSPALYSKISAVLAFSLEGITLFLALQHVAAACSGWARPPGREHWTFPNGASGVTPIPALTPRSFGGKRSQLCARQPVRLSPSLPHGAGEGLWICSSGGPPSCSAPCSPTDVNTARTTATGLEFRQLLIFRYYFLISSSQPSSAEGNSGEELSHTWKLRSLTRACVACRPPRLGSQGSSDLKMKPSATYELLVDGVGPWDFTGRFVPCELLLVGEDAYPVLLSSKKQVLIAVSQYGKGRMVVVSHEAILKNSKFSQFLRNAVEWLKPSPSALVGVHPRLDSLSQLLLKAGTEVRAGAELSPSLGVYCVEAYGSVPAKDLVGFVKGGGGLLIGGQAWYWASQHGKEKVLFEFPGNQVTSVAGVYFTGNTVEKGIFKVAKKIPKIPLLVPHHANLGLDAEALLRGVPELDLATGGVPSALLLHGQLSFPLCLDASQRCLLAAARYGRGRVVVATHESQLFSPKLATFLLNAVRWLGAGRSGPVGVEGSLKKLCGLLCQGGVQARVSQLTGAESVYCCSAYSGAEADRVHAFVAEGGGLLIGGQAWYWASQNPGKAAVAEYPGNRILNRFGVSILGQSARAARQPAVPAGEHYHFRGALALLRGHLERCQGPAAPPRAWLRRLAEDCAAFLQIPAQDCPAYASLHRLLAKALRRSGIPRVGGHCPVRGDSQEAVLLCMATELAHSSSGCAALLQPPAAVPCACAPPVTVEIDGTNPGKTAWRSTGLYLPEGHTAVITFPCLVVGAGLKVQVGCHTDDLSHARELKRAPVVTRTCDIAGQELPISCLWGGLIYILVPARSHLGKVPITVEGAVRAPFFRLGETCAGEWKACIRHYPAPWAELAVENLILTVPSDSIRPMEDPQPLLTLWNEIMVAISQLAAIPAKFPRPERIVTDVQLSCGWMHSGYPIMGHLESVKELVDVEHMKTTGLWGPVHELGHNQQQQAWEFPPHTTEATCNLWSVYVHEKVLGIPRQQAHQALRPQCREERIRGYLKKGAQLKDWQVWTALETYLQLQEGFGWEPFIQLFSDYQEMLNIPKDKPSKMNLWAQKFSQQVNKNLAPFFTAWGWPIKKELSEELSVLPAWEEDPMRSYRP